MDPVNQDNFIEAFGHKWLRVPVVASLKIADPKEIPGALVKATQEAASKLYWQDPANPDLVWVKFILDSEGANANWDYMPRSQLVANHSSAKFKPMDMEHIVKEQASMIYMDKQNPPVTNTIFGVMTHTALADANGNLLTPDQIKAMDLGDNPHRPDSEKVTAVAWAALYAFLFPKTVTGLVQSIAAGTMKVSMERWIKDWDFLVMDQPQGTSVAKATAEQNGIYNKWAAHQTVNGQPIYRRSLAYTYGGVASTTNPAQPLCQFIPQSVLVEKAAATKKGNDEVLEILLNLHSEVHTRFAVSTTDVEKQSLVAEHVRVTRAIANYISQ